MWAVGVAKDVEAILRGGLDRLHDGVGRGHEGEVAELPVDACRDGALGQPRAHGLPLRELDVHVVGQAQPWHGRHDIGRVLSLGRGARTVGGMGTFDGGPRPDFFTLSDAGHGRIPRGGRAIALDRLIAQGWIEVARYPNDTVAGEALDEAVGDGGAANEWRLRWSRARVACACSPRSA